MQISTYLPLFIGLFSIKLQAEFSYDRFVQVLPGRKTLSIKTGAWQPSDVTHYCDSMTWLSQRQRELCLRHPDIIANAERGAEYGHTECQHQFRNQRWNCSIENATDIFSKRTITKARSAETAFVHAVMSAGVTYSVTRACGMGILEECGCDTKYLPSSEESNWNWDGCNDNIGYGMYFSRDFMDAIEDDLINGLSLMNIHNNEAGRQVIKHEMYTKCKCHGVSGSCTSKICWRTMRKMRDIGDILMDKYFQAIRVKYAKKRKRLRPHSKTGARLPVTELVYLDTSPDWCEPNKKYFSHGTHGRFCNKTSRNSDSCALMCCGRGYQIMERRVEESCNCRFHWCCVVTCESCIRDEELHICN
ncbi:WntA-like protein [Saccoglossus kowalevskii]|uniref:Protein Wnt n=1 Tax=Saccoglossus kowalevskii TaxID=10224 RepID=D2XNM4_SACKO|nr:WntA-like protein [Saccoglossus kowalevskii]ADB22654.1 WntA-like protein [Saccoglossus kowalevskii]